MNYKTKKKDNASVEITVKYNADEVEDAFQDAYEQARKQLKLPGFRKGKVPRELAEKHLGDSVANEAARRMIARTIRQIIEELDPPAISMPQFTVEEFERGKGASYSGTYDTRPEVKLAKYKKRRITVDELAVNEDAIDERLNELRRQHASMRTREEGEAGVEDDLYTLDLSLLEGDASVYADKEFRFRPAGSQGIPGLKEELAAAKIGSEGRYEAEFPEEFGERKFAGKRLMVNWKVVSIQATELPELNDEFASEVGEHENLAALRASIRDELAKQATDSIRKRAVESLIDEVVAESKYVVPRSLVDQEMDRRLNQLKSRLGAKELTVEDLANYTKREVAQVKQELEEAATEGIKRDMALMEIAEKEGISIGPEDIDTAIRSRFGAMLPEDQLKGWMQQESIRENVEGSLLFERTIDWLYDHADIKKGRQVSLQEAISAGNERK